MKKKTTDFIRRDDKKSMLSVEISEHLKEIVDHERKELGITWVQLVDAMFLKFLDEQKILAPKN